MSKEKPKSHEEVEELKRQLKELLDEYYDYDSMDGIEPIEAQEAGTTREGLVDELRERALSICSEIDPESTSIIGMSFGNQEDHEKKHLSEAVKRVMPEYYQK